LYGVEWIEEKYGTNRIPDLQRINTAFSIWSYASDGNGFEMNINRAAFLSQKYLGYFSVLSVLSNQCYVVCIETTDWHLIQSDDLYWTMRDWGGGLDTWLVQRLKITIFRNVTPCSLVEWYKRVQKPIITLSTKENCFSFLFKEWGPKIIKIIILFNDAVSASLVIQFRICVNEQIDSKGFCRCRITLGITAFLNFVRRPVFFQKPQ
jgi:hypothetical protein